MWEFKPYLTREPLKVFQWVPVTARLPVGPPVSCIGHFGDKGQGFPSAFCPLPFL
ncbi:MAG: hypothetical protein JOZ78_01085 [Chroococcidiopsidaceae cyanobacterium CP_BM_ER_R8_30]|nr:hypothetical protein [Chroococcidiopsidaceae cyanobacterium CP_BM_ER_R8_30]